MCALETLITRDLPQAVADNPNTKTYFFYNSNLACCEESEVQSSASFNFISFLAPTMTL